MAKIGRAKQAKRVIGEPIEPLESRVLLSTIVVNTTIDGLFPPSSGIVSLRNAIASANRSSTATTITFDPNAFAAPKTVTLNGTGLVVTGSQPTTISGPAVGLTVDGSALASVFQINTGSTANISNLTLTNGSGGGGTGNPGLGGGGIYVGGTATLTDVTITGNTANYGGGINNNGTLNLINVSVLNNTATYGGGLGGAGNFSLTDVMIGGNTAEWGAGFNSNGKANLTNVSIAGNHGTYGGGMDNGGGTAILNNVTISGNSAGNGGGLENTQGDAVLTNVTISQNTADYGAGIDNGGTLTLTNCTIAGNTANSAGGGLYHRAGVTATLSNTLIAHNVLAAAAGAGAGADASGSINSLGYNLIGQTDGSTGWNAYDLTGTALKPLDPKLSPLGNYGGPTQTMALLAGSPALNAGWSALAVDANDNPLTTDQRGLPRIYGSSVDIGAYESQPPTLAGDVNHDGTVNLADLLLLTRDFGKTTPMYEGGDLDGDGNVGISDFLVLARNFGKNSVNTASALASSASVQPLVSGSDRPRTRSALRRPSLAGLVVG